MTHWTQQSTAYSKTPERPLHDATTPLRRIPEVQLHLFPKPMHRILGQCHVGSYGYTPFDVDNKNCPGQHEHIGVWYYGTDYSRSLRQDADADICEALLPMLDQVNPSACRRVHLPSYTYGYIMRRSFPMFIPHLRSG